MNARARAAGIAAAVLTVSLTGCSGGWEQEYADATTLANKIQQHADCLGQPGDGGTMVSVDTADCELVTGDDTNVLGVDIYASETQQEQAGQYLPEINPGSGHIVGPGWSVSVPYDYDAENLASALGGEYHPPGETW